MNTRFGERAAPLAAALTALAAFACCVPFGVVGALGVLALGSLFDALQPWFVTIATLLLAVSAHSATTAEAPAGCGAAGSASRSSACRPRSSSSCCSFRRA